MLKTKNSELSTHPALRVLCTCPPMIRSIDAVRSEFAQRGAEVHCPEIRQIMSEEELIRIVPEFDAWIIGDDPATGRVFEAGVRGKLRAAVKWGVGTDNVDFEGAKRCGLDVANTPGMFGEEVSDVALAYLIGIARDLFAIDRGIRQGKWPKPVGLSLSGKTVALVGFGNIGKSIARKLLTLGMKVTVYDPLYRPDPAILVESAAWPDRLGEADFIILTCALTASSRGMLNHEILELCKSGARVVNVSRGPLIDEAALAEALSSGRVAAAALDVFEDEPLPASSPLRGFDRCVFGSHNSSNTTEAVHRTSLRAIELLFERLS